MAAQVPTRARSGNSTGDGPVTTPDRPSIGGQNSTRMVASVKKQFNLTRRNREQCAARRDRPENTARSHPHLQTASACHLGRTCDIGSFGP
jgi:hypothetical protein